MLTLTLFWTALALLAYTYILFPALVALRGLVRPRPYRTADIEPPVSVIIAAYNEAAGIAARVENLLGLDYPPERLEVVIASDGSTDGTDAIVRRYEGPRVKLLALPRQGKAPTLEAAVAASGGEILVFSDANSMFAPDAIRALVRPLADPEVGGVAGNQRYKDARQATGAAAGESGYWRFDRWLKRSQSQGGSAISATGAIYAIRRGLFQGVPVGVTDDFAVSTRVIAQGYRLVFAPDAVAFEPVASTSGIEFGRKVRIITRGLRGVGVMRELLDPRRHGFYAVQLFSHKVLRRLMVFPLAVLALTGPLLWSQGRFYQLVTLAQVGFYGLALGGGLLVWLGRGGTRLGRLKLVCVPFFFCMVNLAALVAVWNLARGYRIERWEPARPSGAPAGR